MQKQHESHKDNRYIGMCGISGSINSCIIIKNIAVKLFFISLFAKWLVFGGGLYYNN